MLLRDLNSKLGMVNGARLVVTMFSFKLKFSKDAKATDFEDENFPYEIFYPITFADVEELTIDVFFAIKTPFALFYSLITHINNSLVY